MKSSFQILQGIFLIGIVQSLEIGIPNYNDFEVLRVKPTSNNQYETLIKIEQEGTLDFWAGPSNTDPSDILVSPEQKIELVKKLNDADIPYSIFIENIGKIIQDQQKSRSIRNSQKSGMHWDDYQTLDTVYEWLQQLEAAHPQLLTIESIGKSTEGRDLKVLKISTGPSKNGNKKAGFWIDATIHAREWITTATITYIINELVTYNGNYTDIFDALDFYILPVINPDGYVYSHEVDRLWRRTRSDHNSIFGCRGVDANRNYGFQFGGEGSSGDKCSQTYRGPYAYSEPETLAMKNHIEKLRGAGVNLDTFITLHSYSQLWMTPYGYTEDVTDDYEMLLNLGLEATEELKSHYGTEYKVGNAASILYKSSGSSRDWAKGEGGFRLVYTLELRDTGEFGFLLPPEQIYPTAIETWAALQIVAKTYLNK